MMHYTQRESRRHTKVEGTQREQKALRESKRHTERTKSTQREYKAHIESIRHT